MQPTSAPQATREASRHCVRTFPEAIEAHLACALTWEGPAITNMHEAVQDEGAAIVAMRRQLRT